MKKNRLAGISASLLIHVVLLLIAFTLLRTKHFTPPSTKGMEVAFTREIEPPQPSTSTAKPSAALKATSGEINLAHTQAATKPAVRRKVRRTTVAKPKTGTAPQDLATRSVKPAEIIQRDGDADQTNSSTDDNGAESAPFDFRVVEYGHDAAEAIQANIVRPETYRYLNITFRAYITLDHNMQFVKARIIQSTGSNEFDNNIMQALRVTIYPPLPAGADWRQYHEIDFHIKNDD